MLTGGYPELLSAVVENEDRLPSDRNPLAGEVFPSAGGRDGPWDDAGAKEKCGSPKFARCLRELDAREVSSIR